MQLTDGQKEELARLIKDGFTSGRIDSEEDGHCSWELVYNCWKDEPVEIRTCSICHDIFKDKENIGAIDDWSWCLKCDKLKGDQNVKA